MSPERKHLHFTGHQRKRLLASSHKWRRFCGHVIWHANFEGHHYGPECVECGYSPCVGCLEHIKPCVDG